MIGLLLKDFYTIIGVMKTTLLLFLIMGTYFMLSDSGAIVVLAIAIILFSVLAITSLSLDLQNHWDEFVLTMPVTRKNIVLSKYILFALLGLTGGLLGILIYVIAGLVQNNLDFAFIGFGLGTGIGLALFYGSILLPLVYKLGVEKTRVLMILCYLAPAILAPIGFKVLDFFGISKPSEAVLETLLIFGAPAFGVVLFVLSYFISVRIFTKKEF